VLRAILALACLLSLSTAASATLLNVPADHATIQAAIDAAAPGDEVVIAAGTYAVAEPHLLPPGGLSFRGTGEVVLTGSAGAFFEVTDPQNLDLFRFENLRFAGNPVGIRTPVPVNPFPETRLEVENCAFVQNGVGISARNTGLFRLTNCRFEGGAIAVDLRFAWMQAADCVFIGPEVAIHSDEGLADRLVERCLFVDCYGLYGAVSLDGDAYFILNQCTFDRCGATDGAAISSRQGAIVVLDRCIVVGGPGLAFGCIGGLDNLFIITCSDLWNNADGNWHHCGYGEPEENGNFSTDPLFCDPDAGDYSLDAESPCMPANNGCEELIGAYKASCNVTATPSTSISAVKSLY
jgi:hypothetical protein